MSACHFLGNRGPAAAIVAVLAGVAGLAACDQSSAMGEANSLILVADDALWLEVEEDTYAALERTVFTTRDEKIFNVTQTDPGSPEIGDLLLWRQVLVFGPPDDPFVQMVADKVGHSPVEPGEIVQAENVWARGQLATAVVLQPGREAESWLEHLPGLSDHLEKQFRAYVLSRMFVSGVDTATKAFLRENLGFTLEVPNVYQRVDRGEGGVLIRNDNPDPSELIRSILIQRGEAVDSMAPVDGLPVAGGDRRHALQRPAGFRRARGHGPDLRPQRIGSRRRPRNLEGPGGLPGGGPVPGPGGPLRGRRHLHGRVAVFAEPEAQQVRIHDAAGADPGFVQVRGGFLSTASREVLTRTLTDARRGDKEAADALFSQVYDELRAVARRQLGRRRSETLDTAGLVHEAYLRMVDVDGLSFEDRAHFLSYAGAAMRTILVDHARARAAAKRGGGVRAATLDEEMTPAERQAEQLWFIGKALDELEDMAPRLARVVECRFFAGMTDPETAAALGVSDRTVRRDWTKARACLHAALADEEVVGR